MVITMFTLMIIILLLTAVSYLNWDMITTIIETDFDFELGDLS